MMALVVLNFPERLPKVRAAEAVPAVFKLVRSTISIEEPPSVKAPVPRLS